MLKICYVVSHNADYLLIQLDAKITRCKKNTKIMLR